ncbi:decapping and exoribonuclease protein-like [Dermacentor albipictus]|uniref:decapping and exoribonuclease protein-like n=1 Tax=Dermacentor albipictus TaxID=60249 RepID=UPI0031FBA79E
MTSAMPVLPSAMYRGPAPQYSEPQEVGIYSLVGAGGSYASGNVHGKYLCMPPRTSNLNWDLDAGFADVARFERNETPTMDTLLHWILENKRAFSSAAVEAARGDVRSPRAGEKCVPFVCRRGGLHSVLCTPYDRPNDWLVGATQHRGVVYLRAFDTEAWMEQLKQRSTGNSVDHFTYWGHKFEQYMTSERPGMAPDTSSPVVEHESVQVVARSRLGEHGIIIGGEVDAIDPSVLTDSSQQRSMAKYVELKTTALVRNERQLWNMRRYKLWKWWSQSYIMGTKRVVCGCRDKEGFVRSLMQFDVDTMHEQCEREHLWFRAEGLNFCDRFLSFVKSHLKHDEPKVVYLFRYEPAWERVTCERLDAPGEYEVLPEWFLNEF